jgi:hypothetical protein
LDAAHVGADIYGEISPENTGDSGQEENLEDQEDDEEEEENREEGSSTGRRKLVAKGKMREERVNRMEKLRERQERERRERARKVRERARRAYTEQQRTKRRRERMTHPSNDQGKERVGKGNKRKQEGRLSIAKKEAVKQREETAVDLTDATPRYMDEARVVGKRPLYAEVPEEPKASTSH